MVNCPWSPNASCTIELFSDLNSAFIIGSNSPDRREYIEMIKEVIIEFNLEPIFALNLNQYNGKQAFCTNKCSQIRKSRIIVADLSGPTEIVCNNCNETMDIFSVNVFWEYGYASALEKDPILICDESQYVPFDVADKNAEFYNKGNLKELLRPVIQQRLNNPIPFKSNILNIGETTKFQQLHDLFKTQDDADIIIKIKNQLDLATINQLKKILSMQSSSPQVSHITMWNSKFQIYYMPSIGNAQFSIERKGTNNASYSPIAPDINRDVLTDFLQYYRECFEENGININP